MTGESLVEVLRCLAAALLGAPRATHVSNRTSSSHLVLPSFRAILVVVRWRADNAQKLLR